MKTKALISFTVNAVNSRFSHDAAHILLMHDCSCWGKLLHFVLALPLLICSTSLVHMTFSTCSLVLCSFALNMCANIWLMNILLGFMNLLLKNICICLHMNDVVVRRRDKVRI